MFNACLRKFKENTLYGAFVCTCRLSLAGNNNIQIRKYKKIVIFFSIKEIFVFRSTQKLKYFNIFTRKLLWVVAKSQESFFL